MKTTKSKTAATKQITEQDGEKLKELFVDGLKDIYWAEKNLAKALVKLSKSATSEELKSAFELHTTQTEQQIVTVEQVFEIIGEKAQAKKCAAMEGLIAEANEIIESTEKGTMVRDCGLIMAAQKVEHYEIASYGTLRNIARTLGYEEAATLLQQTLDQEGETDHILTELAESYVNQEASAE
ncbi:YciE/YciF ferroxidase family protein [Dyadobacter sandarakinus]|uniref:Ferritin-like domain-containing protein n=1 Tax=Dyadobacter sandarakinus TaxID=2747268 RepID=A0ABX7I2T5_9BACT|nr:ferritin-like domain-containing protein [Dyadobacter sandarakinus]QRQ99831.1 ferritin-like domain-containing protein [Dyadobacter sandarakinus]